MAKKWLAKGPAIFYDGEYIAHTHDSALMEAEGYAAFLVAAAKHYQQFLGETKHIIDADIEPEFGFVYEKTQKGSSDA